MKSLIVTNALADLTNSVTPFLPGRNAVALNPTAGALTLQKSDTDGGALTTLAVVPAAGSIEIPTLPAFIKVSTAANVTLIAGP